MGALHSIAAYHWGTCYLQRRTLVLLYHTDLPDNWSEPLVDTPMMSGSTSEPATVFGLFLALIGAMLRGAASFALICWGTRLRDVVDRFPSSTSSHLGSLTIYLTRLPNISCDAVRSPLIDCEQSLEGLSCHLLVWTVQKRPLPRLQRHQQHISNPIAIGNVHLIEIPSKQMAILGSGRP